MGPKQDTKEIADADGNVHKYFVIQKPAVEGEILKFKLVKLLGSSLAKLIPLKDLIDDKSTAAETKKIEIFMDTIATLFDSNSPDEVFKFLQSLIFNITRDGQRLSADNFDIVYTNNTLEFYKACMFVLQVNYGDFLKGLKA